MVPELKAAPVFRVDRVRDCKRELKSSFANCFSRYVLFRKCNLIPSTRKKFPFFFFLLPYMQEKFGTCTNSVLRFVEIRRDDNSFVLLVIMSVS